MDLNLAGKVALVTGGSKGLGFACAEVLAAEGARVAIVSRSQANIDRALARLPGAYGRAVDLTDAEAADAAIADVVAHVGPIDILVNSAGDAKRVPPDELTPALWRVAMDAKYFTYINAIDPVVKQMARRGAGVIVNIMGIGGKIAAPTHIPGGAANAALMLATAGLAAAYASRGVRVVGLNPGHSHTERVEQALQADARHAGGDASEALARLVARIPLGRLGNPEEIANVVAFLASDRASYVTGVNLSLDGGASGSVV